MVNQPEDGRKAVRFPIKLYNKLVKKYPDQKKGEVIQKLIIEFNDFYMQKRTIIEKSKLIYKHDFTSEETRPIKISIEEFNMLKLIKFETNYSYTDILASAIEYYLSLKEDK